MSWSYTACVVLVLGWRKNEVTSSMPLEQELTDRLRDGQFTANFNSGVIPRPCSRFWEIEATYNNSSSWVSGNWYLITARQQSPGPRGVLSGFCITQRVWKQRISAQWQGSYFWLEAWAVRWLVWLLIWRWKITPGPGPRSRQMRSEQSRGLQGRSWFPWRNPRGTLIEWCREFSVCWRVWLLRG